MQRLYRVDFLVVDINLDLLDALDFEVEILHFPLAVPFGFDGQSVFHTRLTRATPRLAAALQRLPEVVEVERTTRAAAVAVRGGGHRHLVVVNRCQVVHDQRDAVARRF